MTLPADTYPVTPNKTALAVDPSTHDLYAAGVGGVYRSSDGGGSWTPVRALSNCVGLVVLP